MKALALLLAMYRPGDRVVWVQFPKTRGPRRMIDVVLVPAVVVRVTAKRVTIDTDRTDFRRISVTPRKLMARRHD